jgi:hypothetical protein
MIKENELSKILSRFNFLNGDMSYPNPHLAEKYMRVAGKKGYHEAEEFLFQVYFTRYLNELSTEAEGWAAIDAVNEGRDQEIRAEVEEMFGIKFNA